MHFLDSIPERQGPREQKQRLTTAQLAEILQHSVSLSTSKKPSQDLNHYTHALLFEIYPYVLHKVYPGKRAMYIPRLTEELDYDTLLDKNTFEQLMVRKFVA